MIDDYKKLEELIKLNYSDTSTKTPDLFLWHDYIRCSIRLSISPTLLYSYLNQLMDGSDSSVEEFDFGLWKIYLHYVDLLGKIPYHYFSYLRRINWACITQLDGNGNTIPTCLGDRFYQGPIYTPKNYEKEELEFGQKWDALSQSVDHLLWMEDLKHTKLTKLYLGLNALKTLKGLSKFHAPNLEVLSVRWNALSDLDELTKVNFPKLKILQLQRNPFENINSLFDSNFPCLEQLDLDYSFVKEEIKLKKKFPNLKINFLLTGGFDE